MPAKSRAQLGFAAMSRTAAGRKKLRAHGKEPMPGKAAAELMKATKWTRMSRLPRYARKRK